MKFQTQRITCNQRVTGSTAFSSWSDGKLGKFRINEDWFDGVTGMYLEVYWSSAVDGAVDTNYATVKFYDETNAADVTGSEINDLQNSLHTSKSSNFKSYFSGKGEVVLHAELATIMTILDVRRIVFSVEHNGTVTKTVVWKNIHGNESNPRTSYAVLVNREPILFTSGNWDGTLSTALEATLQKSGTATSAEARIYDGTTGQGEVSTGFSFPDFQYGEVTLANGAEYEIQMKYSGAIKQGMILRNAAIAFFCNPIGKKFELHFPMLAYNAPHASPTDTWLQRGYGWSFNPAKFGDCTRAHYYEECAYNAGFITTATQSVLTSGGTQTSNILSYTALQTQAVRQRTASFAEPASSVIDFQTYVNAGAYHAGGTTRHIILITSATNPVTSHLLAILGCGT